MSKNQKGKNGTLEQNLWKAADKLRKNIDAVEYKSMVLKLISLKYIFEPFCDLYHKITSGDSSEV
jgi:type I restriction enzyme M protein